MERQLLFRNVTFSPQCIWVRFNGDASSKFWSIRPYVHVVGARSVRDPGTEPMSDRVAMMGHGSAGMTQYYTHENLDRQRGSVERMATGLRLPEGQTPKVVPFRKRA